jgi:branched-chain amino acid transport system substrate-binding protein
MTKRWLWLPLLAALSLTLLLAACGDDDDDNEQLKIGFLADFSGPLAEFGPEIQTGVELAIKHVNDAGGVNGQDVLLVTGDTQVDTTVALEEARRLVDVEGVHAIVGPLASSISIAVAESVTGDAEVPTVSPSATFPALSEAADNGYLFRSTVSDEAQARFLAQLATEEGYDNVGVMYLNDTYGQGLSAAFEKHFTGTATLASYEDGAASYLSELQATKDGGANVLVAIGFPTQASIFLREALENDLYDEFLFVDGTKSEDLIDEFGAALEGFKGTAPIGRTEADAAGASWNEAYIAEYGSLPTRPFVREAYDAAMAIMLAAEAADSLSGPDLRDAMVDVASPLGLLVIPGAEHVAEGLEAIRNGDDVDYDGAATTLDWNANGDVTTGVMGIWQYTADSIAELESFEFDLEE